MKLASMNISNTKHAIKNREGDSNEPSMLSLFLSIQLG